MKYSLNKIIDSLELRLKAFDLNYISIFPAHLLENYGNDLDRVLKMIKDNNIQIIDLKFIDTPGIWQHCSFYYDRSIIYIFLSTYLSSLLSILFYFFL
jgi:hypothetical protein